MLERPGKSWGAQALESSSEVCIIQTLYTQPGLQAALKAPSPQFCHLANYSMLSELTRQVERRTSFSSPSAVLHIGALRKNQENFPCPKALKYTQARQTKGWGGTFFQLQDTDTEHRLIITPASFGSLKNCQVSQVLEQCLSTTRLSQASNWTLLSSKVCNYYHNQNNSNIWTRRQVVSCFCITIKSSRNDCIHACVLQSHVECGFLSNNCSLSRGKEEFTGKRTLVL